MDSPAIVLREISRTLAKRSALNATVVCGLGVTPVTSPNKLTKTVSVVMGVVGAAAAAVMCCRKKVRISLGRLLISVTLTLTLTLNLTRSV